MYMKPGNAYAHLADPCGTYHSIHVFRGWLKAEMHRQAEAAHTLMLINIYIEEHGKLTINSGQLVILHVPLTPHFAKFPGISETSCWSQK